MSTSLPRKLLLMLLVAGLVSGSFAIAADKALEGVSGVAGLDEDQNDELRVIEFPRIKGGKPFNIDEPWFEEMLAAIGQPKGARIAAH